MPEPTDDSSTPDQGWDSVTTLVQGRWIDRRPRRPAVAERLRLETKLLPWLADQLPLQVPKPFVVQDESFIVRHELVPGQPIERLDKSAGRSLGRFLRALHDIDVTEAVGRGLPTAEISMTDRAATLNRFRETVIPLLLAERRNAGTALLDTLAHAPADILIHGDLRPEHILCVGHTVTGVIDFNGAHIGDRAVDLSWALCDTPTEFASAVAEQYGADTELRDRAILWHQLGPWYEVVYGQDQDLPRYVRSGLAGVMRRLR